MLVSAKEVWQHAKANGYAACAPNIFDAETARLCIEAAEELNAPVILDFGYKNAPKDYKIRRESLDNIVRAVEYYALPAKVPVVLQQDHGRLFETGICCIAAGFTSVMADRSQLPFEENVAQVAEIVRIAHACGVSVEAELGHVGSGANYAIDGISNLTEPEKAAEYVERTGVDALAVAIGTAHGAYKGTPKIDFERFEEIKKAVDIPLVLHGGSGSGDENLSRLATSGICKVNVCTALIKAGNDKLDTYIKEAERRSVPMDAFYEGYKEEVKRHMKLFNSVGKA